MKKLFFTLAVAALAFTACNNNDDVVRPPQAVTITATGITGATNVTQVKAVVTGSETVTVFTSPFAAGGFTMPLIGTPDAAALNTLYTYFPNGTAPTGVTATHGFKVFDVTLIGNAGTTESGRLINESTTANNYTRILYWYVDRDAHVTGTDMTGDFDHTYALTLKKGWNRVLQVTNNLTNVITLTSPFTGTSDSWVFNSSTALALPLTAQPFTGTDVTGLVTMSATANAGAVVIAAGSLATGNFTVNLPATAPAGATLAPWWATAGAVPAGVEISNIAAKYFQIEFRGYDAVPALDGFFLNQNTAANPTSRAVYWYVDRPVEITGHYTPAGTDITLYNLHLHIGWNKVLVTTTVTTNTTITYTSPIPAGSPTLNWYYVLDTPPI